MAYKGRRDDYLRIRVPQKLCTKVILKSGDFVEIAIPGSITSDTWESWMVREDQVFYDRDNPDKYNIIDQINDKTDIRLLTKGIRDGVRIIIENSERFISTDELKKIYS